MDHIPRCRSARLILTQNEPINSSVWQERASDAFFLIYPVDNTVTSDVKIWEIRYPSDITTDVTYLKTGVPEIDNDLTLP